MRLHLELTGLTSGRQPPSRSGSASHGGLRQALYGVLVRLQIHDRHARNLHGHSPLSPSCVSAHQVAGKEDSSLPKAS